MQDQLDRIIAWRELKQYVPFNHRYLLCLEAQGLFPKRVRLSARRMGWSVNEVTGWIEAKKAERS
jgi:predicted DNA-binding transcriptional regulator AlpA